MLGASWAITAGNSAAGSQVGTRAHTSAITPPMTAAESPVGAEWRSFAPITVRNGVPLTSATPPPTSRSLTIELPKMRFQFVATPQNGFSDPDANDSGMMVFDVPESLVCRE